MQIAKLAVRGALPRAWSLAAARGPEARSNFYMACTRSLAFAVILIPLWIVVRAHANPSGARRNLVHRGSRMMLAAAGVPVEIEGGEFCCTERKAGPWIFAPNHSSYLDILAIAGIFAGGCAVCG